jgi:hypothetical protein
MSWGPGGGGGGEQCFVKRKRNVLPLQMNLCPAYK